MVLLNNRKISLEKFKRKLKNIERGIDNDFSLIQSYENTINKYLVELHKKYNITKRQSLFSIFLRLGTIHK